MGLRTEACSKVGGSKVLALLSPTLPAWPCLSWEVPGLQRKQLQLSPLWPLGSLGPADGGHWV